MSRRASVLSGRSTPAPTEKASATAEAHSQKDHYRALSKEFRHDGFTFRQIARQGDAAIYKQSWTGSAEPSPCWEVIRIRRRKGFQIDGRFVEPAEVYPNSDAWGIDGFTFTNRDKAWAKFFELTAKKEGR